MFALSVQLTWIDVDEVAVAETLVGAAGVPAVGAGVGAGAGVGEDVEPTADGIVDGSAA